MSTRCVVAQTPVRHDDTKVSFSYYLGGGLSENIGSATINAYDGSTICGVFRNGSGTSPNLFTGLGFSPSSGSPWSFVGELNYTTLSSNFVTPASPTNAAPRAYRQTDGALIPIVRDRQFDATLGMLSMDARANFRFYSSFAISAGPFVGDILHHRFSETESIREPADALYAENSRGTRDISSGDLAVHTIQTGIAVGVSYEIPFEPNLFLRPGLSALIPLTSISDRSSSPWRVFPIGLTLSLVYRHAPELPTEESTPEQIASNQISNAGWDSLVESVSTPKPDSLSNVASKRPERSNLLKVAIEAYGVADDGKEIAEPVLSVERMHVTEVYPMLHYIFFDDGAAGIPVRYRQRTAEQAKRFDEKALYTSNALEIHHNVLDILGKRLTELPRTYVTLLGTRSEHSALDSAAGTGIALERAQSVADYLHSVWGIARDRLKVKSRGLPEVASDDKNIAGEAENRRVEILPSSSDVTAPLWTERIERIATPPHLDFAPQITVSSGVHITSAMIVVRQRDRILQTFDALTNGSTGEYIWTIGEESMPNRQDSLTYTLTVTDSDNDTASASGVIHLRQETHDATRHESDTTLDKQLERFSLILFDYSSSQVEKKESDQILTDIAKAIDSRSQVTLTGHTDKSGDDAFNERLAQQRVDRAAQLLTEKMAKLGKEKSGMLVESHGSRDVLFDNSLPEGRVLSRTVRALIQNDLQQ